MHWDTGGLALSTLLASAVEFVEALTIVLAMGVTRGWRSALAGTAAAVAALAVVGGVAGYALVNWFPRSAIELVVGALLLVFGLQWLRKAILRSAGILPLNDEDLRFRTREELGRSAAPDSRWGLDWLGFAVSFKGVFLEGLEVIFIVVTFGLSAHSMATAVAAASAGGAVVLVAGIWLHRPLARVPENTMKLAVGLLLSTFGTFWSVEGLGAFRPGSASVVWPGGEGALPAVLAAWCLLAWLSIRGLSRYGAAAGEGAT